MHVGKQRGEAKQKHRLEDNPASKGTEHGVKGGLQGTDSDADSQYIQYRDHDSKPSTSDSPLNVVGWSSGVAISISICLFPLLPMSRFQNPFVKPRFLLLLNAARCRSHSSCPRHLVSILLLLYSSHLAHNIQEYVCARYAVLIRCVLLRVVADALDARHKDHGSRADARHHLGILACARSHAAGIQSSCCGGCLNFLYDTLIKRNRIKLSQTLAADLDMIGPWQPFLT